MIAHHDSNAQRLHEALLMSATQRARVIARIAEILDREGAEETGDITRRLEGLLESRKRLSMTAGLPALRRQMRGLR